MRHASPIIALLGGTFDPIHYGHLRLAADVKSAVGLDEVRLIPAGDPPHRAPPVASAEHRLAMTELGCEEFTGLVADAREVHRAGRSYTVLTLESMRAEEPMHSPDSKSGGAGSSSSRSRTFSSSSVREPSSIRPDCPRRCRRSGSAGS